MTAVRVSVRQHGGLFGVDRVSEVDGRTARLVEEGAVTATRQLAAPVGDGIAQLAEACAAVLDADGGEAAGAGDAAADVPADSMATEVRIEQGGTARTLTFASGDDVPAELKDLVAAVLDAPHRDPGTRWAKRS